MSTEHHLSLRFLFSILFMVIAVAQVTQALSFQIGNVNVTTTNPELFGCKKITFQHPFHGGKQVKIFASVGHSVKSSNPRNGAAIWVDDATAAGFTVCVEEYADGSHGTTEVNWIALETAPVGTQLGTASLDSWTTGTKCKTIVFKQSFKIPPNIFVTASHQSRPQDAMAIWVEQIHKDSFKVCLTETKIHSGKHENIKINWMAFTDQMMLEQIFSDNVVFNKTSSGSEQENDAVCQDPHIFAPVVVVSPTYRYSNDHTDSSQCGAVAAWIEYTSRIDTKICVRNYNSNPKNNDAIVVDYMVITVTDVCRTNRHSCDVNAICQTTEESYTCTCKLGFQGDGRNCFVPSRPPPMITKFKQEDLNNKEDVHLLSIVKLPCNAKGTNLTWTWRHNDKEITNFVPISTVSNPWVTASYSLDQNGSLIGKRFTPEQNGTYQCFVKDMTTGIEVFSRKLQVVVSVAGKCENDKCRENVVKKVELGKPFRYECPQQSPTSFAKYYNWKESSFRGIYLSRKKRIGISPNGTLLISYVNQEDIDWFKNRGIVCRIQAGNGNTRSGPLKLEKKDPKQSDPGTKFPPQWAYVPAEKEVAIEGRIKVLYCFANGRPAPNITWTKNGRKIDGGQNFFVISNSYFGRRLEISNVSRANHQDVYTCEAENSHNKKKPLIRRINLVVKVPPKWTEGPPPRRIDIKGNKTIECKVTADPEATIMWYKNGKPLQSSEFLKVDGDKLHLTNVNHTDDGVYQCAAENEYGSIVSETWVHRRAKPSFANVQFGPFTLLHGSEGQLQCHPSAQPPPSSYKWSRNGVLISGGVNSRYIVQPGGTLLIKKVDKFQDSVNYTCTAQNIFGRDSATTVPVIVGEI